MRKPLLEWKDVTGDDGNLQIPYDDGSIISIALYDNSEYNEVHACHNLDIPTARALHEALGRALAEVDPQPAPTLHPRPFHWTGTYPYDFGIVNSGNGMTTEGLLRNDPQALAAMEDTTRAINGAPCFGNIGACFTGPRTLREYLTSPSPDESALNQLDQK